MASTDDPTEPPNPYEGLFDEFSQDFDSEADEDDIFEDATPPTDLPFIVDPDGTLTLVYPNQLDIIDTATTPPADTTPPFTTTPYVDQTRRHITYFLIGILAFLTIVGAIGWLWHGSDIDRMQSFAVLFSPVVTLVGAALGYFGRGTE